MTRVLLASVLWRIVCVCLLLVSTHAQPAFDTSGELVRLTLSLIHISEPTRPY